MHLRFSVSTLAFLSNTSRPICLNTEMQRKPRGNLELWKIDYGVFIAEIASLL